MLLQCALTDEINSREVYMKGIDHSYFYEGYTTLRQKNYKRGVIMADINPNRQTIRSCLNQRTYYIDFYQREYVWSKETVEVLLNDIFDAFEQSYCIHKESELSKTSS